MAVRQEGMDLGQEYIGLGLLCRCRNAQQTRPHADKAWGTTLHVQAERISRFAFLDR